MLKPLQVILSTLWESFCSLLAFWPVTLGVGLLTLGSGILVMYVIFGVIHLPSVVAEVYE